MGDTEISLGDEPVQLCGEGGVYWPRGETLFVADLHWGKTTTFRAHAIPVGDGPLHTDLARLTAVIERTGAKRVVVLGDLLHHRRGRAASLDGAVAAWRERHRSLEMVLVRGNHDRAAGDPAANWGIECVDEGHPLGPFILRHIFRPHEGMIVLAGHEHPKVHLQASGDKLKLPCFWRVHGGLILPAFSRFIDSAVVNPSPGDEVFVLVDNSVVPVRPRQERRAK